MEDKSFRVLLNLTDLHIEHFKYVWINVCPRELITISDFKAIIKKKINLERDDFKLFVRDGLLLEQETIFVLRENDIVKVQCEDSSQLLPTCDSGKKNKNSVKKRNSTECNVDEYNVIFNKKRCKLDSKITENVEKDNYSDTSNFNQKKLNSTSEVSLDKITDYSENLDKCNKLKCKKKKKDKTNALSFETNFTESNVNEKCDSFFSFDITNNNEQHESTIFSEKQDNLANDSKKESSPKIIIKQQEIKKNDTIESFDASSITENNGVTIPKKKRKRRRKRKHTESAVTDTSNIDVEYTSFSDNEGIKGKHVIYSSISQNNYPSVIHNTEGVEESPKDTFVVSKNMSLVNVESTEDYPKISTPSYQSNGCSNPNWQVSLVQSRNSVKEVILNKTNVTQNNSVLSNKEKTDFQVQYDDLPAIKSMPKIGTYIAYKALELDESYSPVISEYREGIIQSINPDTEEVNIELLKHVIKPGRTGKFENLKEDEFPPPEIKKYDLLRWSDVISPKQLC